MTRPSCREASAEAGETLAGKALGGRDRWVVLEYRRPWTRHATEENDLPVAVQKKLAGLRARHPRVRVQFIRGLGGEPGEGLTCFLADSGEEDPHLCRLPLESHEDLLDLDLEGWAAGQADLGRYRMGGSTYLVCVHARRDRCCARLGMPVYRELCAQAPGRAWQTSHLGGHRFAATVLCLPEGLSYGRVRPEEVGELVRAHRRGELWDLERYRGRTCYPAPAQAGDAFLRARLAEMRVDALRLDSLEDRGKLWHLRFREAASGRIHEVEVARESLGMIPLSCGEDPEPAIRFVPAGRRPA